MAPLKPWRRSHGAFSLSHACGTSHLLYVYPQHQPSPVMRPQLLAGHLQPRARHTSKVQHLATCTQQRGHTQQGCTWAQTSHILHKQPASLC